MGNGKFSPFGLWGDRELLHSLGEDREASRGPCRGAGGEGKRVEQEGTRPARGQGVRVASDTASPGWGMKGGEAEQREDGAGGRSSQPWLCVGLTAQALGGELCAEGRLREGRHGHLTVQDSGGGSGHTVSPAGHWEGPAAIGAGAGVGAAAVWLGCLGAPVSATGHAPCGEMSRG